MVPKSHIWMLCMVSLRQFSLIRLSSFVCNSIEICMDFLLLEPLESFSTFFQNQNQSSKREEGKKITNCYFQLFFPELLATLYHQLASTRRGSTFALRFISWNLDVTDFLFYTVFFENYIVRKKLYIFVNFQLCAWRCLHSQFHIRFWREDWCYL